VKKNSLQEKYFASSCDENANLYMDRVNPEFDRAMEHMIIISGGSGRVLVGPPDFKSGVLAVEVGWWVRFPCASAKAEHILNLINIS
jgi:hypothetical protein